MQQSSVLTSAFFAGLAPLSFTLSPERIRYVSALGTGVLVGTSLVVIIPEGVETLNSVDTESIRQTMGLSLVSGFVLMYIIEKVPDYISQRRGQGFLPISIDLGALRPREVHSGDDNVDQVPENSQKSTAMSTSVGLVIHSLADGIALGASISSENVALELLVFLAIMIHKAPAAFGFSTVLLREDLSMAMIKRHLAAFAAAAPLGALITFAIIEIFGSSGDDSIMWWTGVLLIFSGGTFLFVAVHALQRGDDTKDPPGNEGPLFLLTVAGMLFPLVTLAVPDI